MKLHAESNNFGKLLMIVFLVLLTLLPYYQVLNFGFNRFDDCLYVYDNRYVKDGFNLNSLGWAFTNFESGNWHPLTWISHIIDVELFGLNAGGHHWTNLILHIVNSLLLFLIFYRETDAMLRSFFLAGLFAVHPLHVESVVWISERKDVLSTLFFLVTVGTYLQYVRKKSVKKYFAIFLFLTLGLMAKAMLVTLPFVLLLLDVWPLKRAFIEPDERRKGFHIGKMHLAFDIFGEKLPLLIPVILFSMVAVNAQKSVDAFLNITIVYRLANCFISYVSYAGKIIWPENLAVFYPWNPFPIWKVLVSGLLIFIVSFVAIKNIKKVPYLFVGWFWYIGTLIPVIGLVQVGGQAIADRYAYIPSIGFFIIFVWGLHDVLWRIQSEGLVKGQIYRFFWHPRLYGNDGIFEALSRRGMKIFFASAIMTLALLCARTYSQVGFWQDNITLYQDAIKNTKNNYMAHSLLAREYFEKGEVDKAIENYRESIRIEPFYTNAHINLANAYGKKGDVENTISSLKNALCLEPNHVLALGNLGIAYLRQGKLEDALDCFKKAIKADEGDARVRYLMAHTLLKLNRVQDAIGFYEQALSINEKYEPALYELGELLLTQGKKAEAMGYFLRLVNASDSYAVAYTKLGELLIKHKEYKGASKFFAEAVKLDPNYSLAKENLEKTKKLLDQNRNMQ